MDATVEIFLSAGAKFELDAIEVDEKVHLAGNTSESQLNQSQVDWMRHFPNLGFILTQRILLVFKKQPLMLSFKQISVLS